MAGKNTTGTANSNDYNVGRGSVLFSNNDATTGLSLDYRFLGNSPEFNVNLEVETLEHQSSISGLKTTDKEVVISQSMGLTVSLDEINFENLALFLSGSVQTHTNVKTLTNNPDIAAAVLGRWYDIYDANGNRAYDILDTDVTITNVTDTGDLTLTTEYLIDEKMGRFFLLSTATTHESDNLQVDLADTGSALTSIDEVEALTSTTISGSLKFIGENPADADHQTEWQFHQVSLKAEGDFSLISDDFSVMQLSGKAEKNTGTASGVSGKTLTVRTHTNA